MLGLQFSPSTFNLAGSILAGYFLGLVVVYVTSFTSIASNLAKSRRRAENYDFNEYGESELKFDEVGCLQLFNENSGLVIPL
jgi:hypothetical protein